MDYVLFYDITKLRSSGGAVCIQFSVFLLSAREEERRSGGIKLLERKWNFLYTTKKEYIHVPIVQ